MLKRSTINSGRIVVSALSLLRLSRCTLGTQGTSIWHPEGWRIEVYYDGGFGAGGLV